MDGLIVIGIVGFMVFASIIIPNQVANRRDKKNQKKKTKVINRMYVEC